MRKMKNMRLAKEMRDSKLITSLLKRINGQKALSHNDGPGYNDSSGDPGHEVWANS